MVQTKRRVASYKRNAKIRSKPRGRTRIAPRKRKASSSIRKNRRANGYSSQKRTSISEIQARATTNRPSIRRRMQAKRKPKIRNAKVQISRNPIPQTASSQRDRTPNKTKIITVISRDIPDKFVDVNPASYFKIFYFIS